MQIIKSIIEYVSKNVKYLKQKFSLKRNDMKHVLRIE